MSTHTAPAAGAPFVGASGTTSRLGGYAALGGAASMIVGAVFWGVSGVDLDQALAAGTVGGYLEAAAEQRALLVANLTAWIATALIVGIGPAVLSLAGRGEWVPEWLVYWGLVAALAGLATTVAMFTDALSSYGFLIVPVGLGWTLAAGVVVLRRARGA